jgi:hypothetical protein
VTGQRKRHTKDVDTVDGDEASDVGDSMEEWEAVEAEAVSVVTSVDTDVDTDVDHADRELDAEEAAEAADGQGDDLVALAAIGAAAAIGAEPARDVAAVAFGAEAFPRAATGTFVFWRNEYFFMSHHGQDIRVRVYQQGHSHEEMCPRAQSRTIRPTIYGDDTSECPKCTLVLRAWAAWRMALTDWAERRLGRVKQVATDEGSVKAYVHALGEPDGLLGNAPLNRLLRAYVPNAAPRLAATARGEAQ